MRCRGECVIRTIWVIECPRGERDALIAGGGRVGRARGT